MNTHKFNKFSIKTPKGLVLAIGVAFYASSSLATEYNISAKNMTEALMEFSAKSGAEIIFPSQDLRGIISPSLQGDYSLEDGLELLLSGSGLTYVKDKNNVIFIQAQAKPSDASIKPEKEKYNEAEVEEIIVTGTNIRGVKDGPSPVMVIDRAEIEQSGYSTLQDFLDSLPQNFGGGGGGGFAEDGAGSFDGSDFDNRTRVSGISLRGLGGVATLVLINGHRVAPSSEGRVVDVSLIPLAAIERVEVLTDGASAIYGADAVAGVVNFILRSDYDGAETRVRYGGATQGSLNEIQASQTFGKTWDKGNALFTLDYAQRDVLPAKDREFSKKIARPFDLLPETERHSFVASVKQQLSNKLDFYSDINYSMEDESSYSGSVETIFTETDSRQTNAVIGLRYDVFDDWRLDLSGGYSQSLVDYQFLLEGFEKAQTEHDFDQWSLDFKADGSIMSVSGGDVKLALGASYREEDFVNRSLKGLTGTVYPDTRADLTADREVKSFSGELLIPIIGDNNAVPGIQRLQLTAAVRYDDYSDFGSTTNPKIGVLWSPTESLDFRASYSTSFRPPAAKVRATISGLGGASSVAAIYDGLFTSPDGSGTVPALIFLGTDPTLSPEESENLSVGFTFQPLSVSGLTLELNYFDIEYTDKIANAPVSLLTLTMPDTYGAVITEFASVAELEAAIADEVANNTFFDFYGGPLEDVLYAIDWRTRNLSAQSISGVDLTGSYSFDVGENSFYLRANISYILDYASQIAAGANSIDQLNTFNNPTDLRMRSSLSWSRANWSATASLNYTSDYVDNRAGSGNVFSVLDVQKISSWTTMDLNVTYDFGEDGSNTLAQGLRVSLNVQNLFDRDPPRVQSVSLFPMEYDTANAGPLGRFVALQLTKAW